MLRLIEYLTPTVNFTNIRATKVSYANALSLGTNNCKNEDRGYFEQRTLSKKAVKLSLEQQQGSLRDLLVFKQS